MRRMRGNKLYETADLMQTGGVSQVIAQTDLANQYQQFTRQQDEERRNRCFTMQS